MRARSLAAWTVRRVRLTGRIAHWECSTGIGTIDRRTALALLAVLLVAGAAAPATFGAAGSGIDDGIYRVAVDEDHRYHDAVAEWPALRVVDDPERADLVLVGDRLAPARAVDDRKAQAARSELRSAIEAYNERRLAAEDDEAAAFPIVVEVTYGEQVPPTRGGIGPAEGDGGDGSGDGTDGAGGDVDDGSDLDDAGGADDSGASDGTDGDAGSADDDGASGASDGDTAASDGGWSPLGGDGPTLPNFGGRFGGDQSGTPAEISPPFPFGSLLLAFLFVIPMNFVIQAYASTIVDERLNRRGELLLVAPVSRLDVVGGKTLPYLGAMAALTVGIAALVGGGLLTVVGVLPIALLFLATTFVAAMFARSYKELTFLTVTISVLLTSYVFIPAIFTDVTPIALISPLTLVVLDLQNESVSALAAAFSTGPFLLSAAVLYGLGLGVYREEDMFTQRPVHAKALDALAAWISKPWHVAATSGLLLPFVFVLELLFVAVLFVLPEALALVVIMLFVAVVEEVAKSAHVYASFAHGRFDRTWGSAALLGVASGTGFFVAEKFGHAIQLVGLDELAIGQLTFTPSLAAEPLLGLALFLLPLALHCVTAAISALGARRGPRQYAVALTAAILVHAAYNLGVIAVVA